MSGQSGKKGTNDFLKVPKGTLRFEKRITLGYKGCLLVVPSPCEINVEEE